MRLAFNSGCGAAVKLEKLGVPLHKKSPVLHVLQVLLKMCLKVITRSKVSSKDQEYKCIISKQPHQATYESLFDCSKKEELTVSQNISIAFLCHEWAGV